MLDLSVPGDAPALIDLAHDGSSNFIVWSLNGAFAHIDLLVNEIGNYNGRIGLNTGWFTSSGLDPVRHLEIDADGNWTLTVRPMSQARAMTGSLNGHGDEVVRYQAGSVMHSTHDGTKYSSSSGQEAPGGRKSHRQRDRPVQRHRRRVSGHCIPGDQRRRELDPWSVTTGLSTQNVAHSGWSQPRRASPGSFDGVGGWADPPSNRDRGGSLLGGLPVSLQ